MPSPFERVLFRRIRPGVERLRAGLVLRRHRHREGYANIVLAGGFEEASFAGRFRVGPGEVLLHGAFDCHANVSLSVRGPRILRLPWFDDSREGLFRVADPDRLVRVAEVDPLAATAELEGMLTASSPRQGHWTDALASALRANPSLDLRSWSERNDLAPETVSRGFGRAYGTTPRQFRLEVRTRLAWRRIVQGRAPLTSIAHELGFADLAHLTRSVRRLTGVNPSGWRSQVKSVQALRPVDLA